MPDKSSVKILESDLKPKLYKDLIVQLNKDLLLSGVDLKIALTCTPSNLIKQLTKLLKDLVQCNYQTFGQFMYTLDISEEKIKNINRKNFDLFVTDLVQLIVERVMKKVLLKAQFKT